MSWIYELLTQESVAQTIIIYSFVIAIGVVLGKNSDSCFPTFSKQHLLCLIFPQISFCMRFLVRKTPDKTD